MAIYALGFTEQTAYRFSSAMHCINIALYFLWVRRNMQAVDVSDWRTRVIHSSLYTIALVVIVMKLLNASNIVFHGEFGPYFLACILPLVMASLNVYTIGDQTALAQRETSREPRHIASEMRASPEPPERPLTG